MKTHLVALICGLLLWPCAGAGAQSAPTGLTVNTQLDAELVRLGGQMMIAGKAYEYDRHLADDIGGRLSGSENYEKAVAWAKEEFTRMGLKNVHGEKWTIPATWEPESVSQARMIAPRAQQLHLVSEGWSPSTPEGGIRGEVYYLPELSAAAINANAGKMKGKIVLIDGQAVMRTVKEGFGTLFETLDMVKGTGAEALVLGLGTTNNAASLIGLTDFKGELSNITAGNLGAEDTELLKRLLETGPVEIEFSFRNRIRRNVEVENVVAEIPGTDANGEFVLVGGHLDSWATGTGAQDNGTGAASAMAVAEAIMASGLKPKRTMRFVLFGAEEQGLMGSLHYAKAHAGDAAKCAGVFVSDSGAEAPKGWFVFGRKDQQDAIAGLKPYLAPLGAGGTSDEGEFTFETDHAPFLVQGVPSFVLWTGMDKYFALHHKPSDTFDKVNQRDLNLGAAVEGMTAYAFASSPSELKHTSSAEIEEQLKQIKADTAYRDLRDHGIF